ncbi:universal stress protein [Actinocrinis puniceicyclus]|uniref:Universal stress protein n=1 Tax=Actinocrinis puniceicyclus TaxID=977794 RepID=A0A8J8BBK8_9ACTN|nr:universal stress protein [Actinocrinis puniceicyclus]MBS2964162.1 universal stress protein [Actinocrinis puniceicyclus]
MTQIATNFRRIVVGVDTSDNALRAAQWAARQAVDLGLPVHLVHALDLDPVPGGVVEKAALAEARRDDGARLLRRVADKIAELHPYVAVHSEMSPLSAPEALVGHSGESTLVVTGTRGHGGFAGLLLGSVSLKLAAHAHGPTVVVRGEESGKPFNEIVLGVEPQEAEAPIRFAFAMAAQFRSTLTVVRAWWPHPAYSGYYGDDPELNEPNQTAEAEVLVKSLREEYPQVDVTAAAMRGNAVPMLIEAARGSRLLVIGSHRRRSPLSVGTGYVVQGLLSHSPTPVAVVPIA